MIPLAKPGSLLGLFTMLWRINVITRYATLTFLLAESAGSMRARQTSVLPGHLPYNLHLVFRFYLRVIPITSPNEARRKRNLEISFLPH